MMGAIDFDISKWVGEPSGSADPAKAANPAKVEPETPKTLATFAALAAQPLAETKIAPLPAALVAGMDRLTRRQPPRLADRAIWAVVVADAERIVRDGWAARAIGLGWTLLDLFGVGPKDSWEFEGLAVWLKGGELLLLDADRAMAETSRGRAYFNRNGWGHGRDAETAPALLWDFGG